MGSWIHQPSLMLALAIQVVLIMCCLSWVLLYGEGFHFHAKKFEPATSVSNRQRTADGRTTGTQLTGLDAVLLNGTQPSLSAQELFSSSSQSIFREDRGNASLATGGQQRQRTAAADRDNGKQQQQQQQQQQQGVHWAVMACASRAGWAAQLSTTLLVGWANGLDPAATTLVWCDYHGENEPSLLKNLRLATGVSIQYLHPKLRRSIESTYYMALRVPELRGAPGAHLLITEDDVLFQPGIGPKLEEVVRQAAALVGGTTPYMVTLYRPDIHTIGPSDKLLTREGDYQKSLQRRKQNAKQLTVEGAYFGFGTQALLMSPQLRHYMTLHFGQILTGVYKMTVLSDIMVNEMVNRRINCSFVTQHNASCYCLGTRPSLVEHTGASSAIFGNNKANARFHVSEDFPWEVGFPTRDKPGTW